MPRVRCDIFMLYTVTKIQWLNCQFTRTFPFVCNSFDLLHWNRWSIRAGEFVYGTTNRFANLVSEIEIG